MKQLLLFTTIIITIASSNVFAKKFSCTNWLTEGQPYEGTMSMSEENNPKVYDGTMFIGQKTGDEVTIRNWLKNELLLVYDRKMASEIYYTNSDTKHLYPSTGLSLYLNLIKKTFKDNSLEIINSSLSFSISVNSFLVSFFALVALALVFTTSFLPSTA